MTPLLNSVWDSVLCVDLTEAMLARSTAGWRVCADASRLPLPDAAVETVVIGDAPFHVPTEAVLEALSTAGGTDWDAVQSEAGWGSWAVLRQR